MNTRASHLFRVSLYGAICLATIGLWMGEDNPLPYPWFVVFCVVAAYAFTDVWGTLSIPAALHPWLALAVVAFFVREEMAGYKIDPVMPLGHLIMFFQVILLFHVKTLRTDWLLLLTCFLQMLMGALHNNGVVFGVLMGAFLALIVWTMTHFLLLRESERYARISVREAVRSGWKQSVAGSLASSLVIFLAAVMLFLLIPRRGQTAWAPAAHRPGQYLSGFDERIRLGQLGTILESDEEVMTVRMFDEQGQPYHPPEEPYWRGVALIRYETGRWERRLDVDASYSHPWRPPPEKFVRQEVRLQGVHRDVLFGIWPSFRGQTRSGEPLGKIIRDGTLVRPEDAPAGPLQYTLDSVPNGRVRFGDELAMRFDAAIRLAELTQVPEIVAGRLREYAVQHNLTASRGPEEFCRAVLHHLQNPNEFDYTLRTTIVDPNLDPVLDFLLNRKEGHCEYFASAMALLLRSHEVPARVVNGFKGGDWNELFGPSIVVRQKHAHSWVEALVPSPSGTDGHWITLDPTPGQRRQSVVAMVHPTPSILRQVGDISRQIWSNYVLNFNSGEQEAAVYGPVRRLVAEQGRNLGKMFQQAWQARARFNWLAAVGASLFTLALILIVRMGLRLLSSAQPEWGENRRARPRGVLGRFADFLHRILVRWAVTDAGPRLRVPFYDELLKRLEARGLSKLPTWTPKQFAVRAESELERLPAGSDVATIPAEIVQRYYRVRFGHESLNESETQEIYRMLERLGVALSVETLRR